ncbi:MAG: redoxin domain-containing protein [Salinibacter sp.]|uniref:redoxin domain-containing protein n=1 Tax=Salinibacter sp. TaxID=2065818 RepID=UPI0035D43744
MSTDAASAEAVAKRVGGHSFAPVHNGFTVDPDTWKDGVEDLQNDDWRVRALALRDLVREGRERPRAVRALLERDDEHVRHLAAAALGILGEESATEALSRLLRGDPEPVVRSQAAIALGQVGAPSEAVAGPLETEEHRDVRHQCAVALDRIRKNKPAEPAVAEAFAAIDESTFGRVREGDPAPGFTLEDTEGTPWALSGALGDGFVVLIWVFADWCPVCHKEFHGLIDREERFRELGAKVATLECHDRYRCRVMEGKELRPSYWFAEDLPGGHPHDRYPDEIWWPHLVDRGAAVGLRYGIDPWQYAVHSEQVNRPTTVIIDPEGTVRLAHVGTFWGDRPTIGQILKMIETGTFEFEPPSPRRGPH